MKLRRVLFFLCAILLIVGIIPGKIFAQTAPQRVNVKPAPGNSIPPATSTIFWFGQVDPNENYADVRVGYNPFATTTKQLRVHFVLFDRILRNNDKAIVYLDTNSQATTLSNTSYQLTGTLGNATQAFVGTSGAWQPTTIPFASTPYWNGNGIGDNIGDAGWGTSIFVPFASVGLSDAPAEGTVWKFAVTYQDFDENGSQTPARTWPENMDPNNPSTWNELHFGLPAYQPPVAYNPTTVTIQPAFDAMVGGGAVCSNGFRDTRWTDFGAKNWNTEETQTGQINIQSQVGQISDWICFSKYYVNIPLTAIPTGKAITGAQLHLQRFGNSGVCDPNVYPDCPPGDPIPMDSITHAFRVDGTPWSANTITWNNAPKPLENIASTRYSPTWDCSVSPCNTYENPPADIAWDVSSLINAAYQAGQSSVTVALYSSDSEYHSGKYFYSLEDDQAIYRPQIALTYGDSAPPSPTIQPTPSPVPGDINGDFSVTVQDVLLVVQNWLGLGDCGGFDCDVHQDGKINSLDAAVVLTHFGN